MTAWLKLIPSWAYWLLALVVVAGGQQIRVLSAQSVASQAQVELANYRTEVSERDRRAAMFVIQENQRRQAAVEKADAEAQKQLVVARGDAERAGSALERLKLRLATAERRSRDAGNAITAQLSQAAEDTARMRADVLGRVGEAAQLYAGVADDRGIAGTACEKSYDAVRGTKVARTGEDGRPERRPPVPR
jgi:septal ring factor EnvC (AmiA/AmiB activator)